MKSELHQKLQNRAQKYLWDKSYWITRQETPVSIGYCDVWGMKSDVDNYTTVAIEVKVSRNDFLSRSQKYKEKSSSMANRHYVLCPPGLVFPDQIDIRWGLLWCNGEGRIVNKKQAQFVEMTDRQKLWILVQFLSSRMNNISSDLKPND